jgi:hypothetical protein
LPLTNESNEWATVKIRKIFAHQIFFAFLGLNWGSFRLSQSVNSGQFSFSCPQKFISHSFQRNQFLFTIDRLEETKYNASSPNNAIIPLDI